MAEADLGLAGQTLLFYGDGKGKTTAAFGVALRAVGRGWNVAIVQFTKMGEWPPGEPLGEIRGAQRLAPNLEVVSTGLGFVNLFGDPYPFEEHRRAAQEGLQLARDKMASGAYDLLILDEVVGAVAQGQLHLEQVLGVLRDKPRRLNVLITGHDDQHAFVHQLVDVVDLATEMKKVKHPFDDGNQARKGLDY